jgi:hypothetical protein
MTFYQVETDGGNLSYPSHYLRLPMFFQFVRMRHLHPGARQIYEQHHGTRNWCGLLNTTTSKAGRRETVKS